MNRTVADFEAGVDEVAVGMAQVALDGSFIRVNSKFCKMLGYERSELAGQTFSSITYRDDINKSNEAIQFMLQSEEAAVSLEKRYVTKGGRIIWMRVTSTIYRNTSKEPQYFITVLEDITEYKKLDEELANQKLRMVAASKINGVGRMAAGMAHEINNPLTIVLGQASRLKKMAADSALDPKQVYNMAEQIENMAARISDIIIGLRGFAREGSDEPIVSTSLRHILGEALKFSRARILLNRIDLRIDEGEKDHHIKCRGVQMIQALLNLINNAKDAVDGKKKPVIEIKIFSDDKSIGFEVHDSGDGVPRESISSLFQPFFSTKAVGLGTGLGLSITKDIVTPSQINTYRFV